MMEKYKRQKKYDDAHCVRISLKLNMRTDKDIIDHIDMNNKQKSVKDLLRKALEN